MKTPDAIDTQIEHVLTEHGFILHSSFPRAGKNREPKPSGRLIAARSSLRACWGDDPGPDLSEAEMAAGHDELEWVVSVADAMTRDLSDNQASRAVTGRLVAVLSWIRRNVESGPGPREIGEALADEIAKETGGITQRIHALTGSRTYRPGFDTAELHSCAAGLVRRLNRVAKRTGDRQIVLDADAIATVAPTKASQPAPETRGTQRTSQIFPEPPEALGWGRQDPLPRAHEALPATAQSPGRTMLDLDAVLANQARALASIDSLQRQVASLEALLARMVASPVK